ncbi:MAG TPA: response regulator [bacterium]|nr:response regulator [bacterium]
MERKNQKKILIIDDEIGPRESLKILFKDNYEVNLAKDGLEGLATMEKEAYDLVILDLKMSGLGGIEVLRQLREARQQTKVIILTGYGSHEIAQEAQRLGVTAYLNKPFDVFDIRQLVARVINA